MVIGLVDGCPLPNAAKLPPGARRDVIAGLGRAQAAVLGPFRFIGDGANVRQRWKLFPVASRERFRMSIEARRGVAAPWTLVYRPHDDAHTTLGDVLEYRRVRGSWNPGTYAPRGAYPAFASWVARELMRRDPGVDAVRVRMEKIQILPRGAGFRGTGEYVFTETRTRAGLSLP